MLKNWHFPRANLPLHVSQCCPPFLTHSMQRLGFGFCFFRFLPLSLLSFCFFVGGCGTSPIVDAWTFEYGAGCKEINSGKVKAGGSGISADPIPVRVAKLPSSASFAAASPARPVGFIVWHELYVISFIELSFSRVFLIFWCIARMRRLWRNRSLCI